MDSTNRAAAIGSPCLHLEISKSSDILPAWFIQALIIISKSEIKKSIANLNLNENDLFND